MQNRVYVLDASAIIGGFYSKKTMNFTTSDVTSEIKDLKSKIMLQSAIEDGHIEIQDPDSEGVEKLGKVLRESGDILRLSDVDKNIIALAVTLKNKGFNPTLVTDDYSMQNVLKIIGMPYRSVLTEGIKEIVGWVKICKGCKKKYPPEYKFDECEICGTRVIRKRVKKNR
ncbi:PIN domain-containing protein [Methanobacterium paludis]|uniref:Ribonuclease PIN domain-containing protein n=1 Tax=Methanobacterium paludis (strain DSM 25820 / JCM 18151 / SWAN1) TaxID=868131 RepID=F6D271_METPW|nr:ribonuclease VapC2 [Methanobacterium paludis]AEG18588.1 hypothetical protein MSWAN_1574 [Methanobacterium paludis]